MNKQTNPETSDENLNMQNSAQEAGAEEQQPIVEEAPKKAEAQITKSKSVGKKAAEAKETIYQDIAELDKLEQEYSQQEYETLTKLYEETMSDFSVGQVVVGKVLAVNDKEVSIDIGFKSEGTVPVEEFTDPSDVIVGDNIEVYIDDIEDAEGLLVLSKKKADFMQAWDRLINKYENSEIIEGRCARRIKGGIVVDLGGVDAFLPGSQIDVRPIRDFDALIGRNMEFKIVKVNHMRKNIVVSHRVLVEQELKGQREKILRDLERGQILEGTVKNITDFGVFIDLGGVDGLLHINDLSWGRVSHPSEIVSLDQKIKVVVLDFNEAKDRISLGLKQLQPHPWEGVETKYPVGSTVKGKVVSISDYGAFIELEKGVEGLIHISEMSWTQHIKHPSKILSVGETIQVRVLNIQKDDRKISLGLKQLEPDPWETLSEKYPVGTAHKGIVRNLTNFGAFVELEEGIDGLIHISDLSWTKKIRHPGEVVKKGEEVEVVILNVDKNNRRISLGYKQTKDNPWDTLEDRYKPGTLTEGKVVRLIEKGLIVELPEIVDGFVPLSQLAKENISKPADQYQIDDVLTLSVIEFNKDNKKIVLSEKDASRKPSTEAAAGTAVTAPKEEPVAAEEKSEEAPVEKKASSGRKSKKAAQPESGEAESPAEEQASE
ncbi:MAG TPA: 30S ribosomal protein S1 [bacterium]|nr:30S ribosomal protein S1 [bacterium]HNT66791.1 30S ribosomal protein S1 [bacterium]